MSSLAQVFHYHKKHWLQSHRELDTIQTYNGYVHWHAFQCTRYLALGNHAAVRHHAYKITHSRHQRLGSYYLAKSYFLCAEYEQALDHINDFLALHPYHADAVYLLSQVYQAQQQDDLAWQSLAKLASKSKRLKTWLFMAQLVNGVDQFQAMRAQLKQAQERKLVPSQHPHLNQYLAHAALRAEQYPIALSLWHEAYLKALAQPKAPAERKHQPYSAERAAVALKDLKHCLSKVNIPFFLISGTLLGCIREGQLLGHDKDIDVGIWEDVSVDVLLTALRASGLFYVQPQRSPWLVKVKHVNGIPIDIFYHIKEGSRYWHGGIKSRWYNSDFELIEHDFLANRYLIPKNSDLYLTENYGDWRAPKTQFDNVYDTPNSVVTNQYELVVHVYRALINAVHKKNKPHIEIWQNRLQELENIWSYIPK